MALLRLFCIGIFLHFCASLTIENRIPDPRCLNLYTYSGDKAIIWHDEAGIRLQLPEIYSVNNYLNGIYHKEVRQMMEDFPRSMERLEATDSRQIEGAWWEGIQYAPAYSLTTPDVITVGDMSWETLRQKRWFWRKSYVFAERDSRGKQIRWDWVLEAIELYVKDGLKLEYETRKHKGALRQGAVDDSLLSRIGLYRPYDRDWRKKARTKPEQFEPRYSEPARLMLADPKPNSGGLRKIESADGACSDFGSWGNLRDARGHIEHDANRCAKRGESTGDKEVSKRTDQLGNEDAERETDEAYLVKDGLAPKYRKPRTSSDQGKQPNHPIAAGCGPVGNFDQLHGLLENSQTALRLHLPIDFLEDTYNSKGYEADRENLEASFPRLITEAYQRAVSEGGKRPSLKIAQGDPWLHSLKVDVRYSLTTPDAYSGSTGNDKAKKLSWSWSLSYTITYHPSKDAIYDQLPRGALKYIQGAITQWCKSKKRFEPVIRRRKEKHSKGGYAYYDRLVPQALERGEVSEEQLLAWHLTRPKVNIAPMPKIILPESKPQKRPNPRPKSQGSSGGNEPKRPKTSSSSEGLTPDDERRVAELTVVLGRIIERENANPDVLNSFEDEFEAEVKRLAQEKANVKGGDDFDKGINAEVDRLTEEIPTFQAWDDLMNDFEATYGGSTHDPSNSADGDGSEEGFERLTHESANFADGNVFEEEFERLTHLSANAADGNSFENDFERLTHLSA